VHHAPGERLPMSRGLFVGHNIVAQLLAFRTMFILRKQRTSAPEQSRGPLGGRGSGLANLPFLR
jgi:hypothetical protein